MHPRYSTYGVADIFVGRRYFRTGPLTLSTRTWEAVGKRTAKMNAIVGLGLRDRTREMARSRGTHRATSVRLSCVRVRAELGPRTMPWIPSRCTLLRAFRPLNTVVQFPTVCQNWPGPLEVNIFQTPHIIFGRRGRTVLQQYSTTGACPYEHML